MWSYTPFGRHAPVAVKVEVRVVSLGEHADVVVVALSVVPDRRKFQQQNMTPNRNQQRDEKAAEARAKAHQSIWFSPLRQESP